MESTKLITLKISGLALEKDLLAKVEFSSSQGMQKDQIELLNELSYSIDSASYEVLFGNLKGVIAFNKNGTILVSGQLAPKVIYLLKENLPI